jgi:succinate dehydrogenase / fumarate reductase cytochrome b subunit
MQLKQQRPKFLNLLKIHLPVTGITSIAHRISGVLLFLAIPGFIYLFQLSLRDESTFNGISELLANSAVKVIVTLLVWALAHHLLAGIRYLLTDIAIGLDLPAARASAWLVNSASACIFLLIAVVMWL